MNVDDELTATLKFLADVGCGEKIDTRRMTTIPTGAIYSLLRTVWFTDTRDNTEKLISQTIDLATKRFRETYADYRSALDHEEAAALARDRAFATAATAATAENARDSRRLCDAFKAGGGGVAPVDPATVAALESATANLSISPVDITSAIAAAAQQQQSKDSSAPKKKAFHSAANNSVGVSDVSTSETAGRRHALLESERNAGASQHPENLFREEDLFSATTTAATLARERDLSARSAQSADVRGRLERYYADLSAARGGIENLCKTYSDSLHFRSRLNTFREKIDRFLDSFKAFAAPVRTTQTNGPSSPVPPPVFQHGGGRRSAAAPVSVRATTPAANSGNRAPDWAHPPAADEF